MPLSLHTATRRQGKIRGVGDVALRDASSRATKAFYPALSMCDLIFSGVFEGHPSLTLAIVEFEVTWVPYILSTMDYTYRAPRRDDLPVQGRYVPERFCPPQRRTGLPGGRHRHSPARRHRRRQHDVGLRLSAQRVDVPQSRKILAEFLAGVPEDEQARIVGGNAARVYNFDTTRLTAPA
jgi:hypothetical protein